MLNNKIVITLLTIIAVCLLVFTGIKVQEYRYNQQVLREAEEKAKKEHETWKAIGERTTEQIEEQTKPAHRYKPVF